VADVLAAAAAGCPLTANDLDAALDSGLLTVVYQPVVELATGRVVAVEALARLRDPAGGRLRTPDTFIPLAEQAGRVGRIDRQVLASAVPFAVRCRALIPQQAFSISVNLSVAGLDAALPAYVEQLCEQAGLPPDALVLELTETLLSDADEEHARVLQQLHDLGCNVTMDDFGTGYSSLSHLVRFPVDGIKVDRGFVWDIDSGGRGAAVARALVGLGADLGLHVVAEGVETTSQLRELLDAGCPYAQGYLFSRPLPAEELLTYLRRGPLPLPSDLPQPRTGTHA
jgi:EAL domain-containing protein (putative c-di-GMP-specific phosphodiesterase class I)